MRWPGKPLVHCGPWVQIPPSPPSALEGWQSPVIALASKARGPNGSGGSNPSPSASDVEVAHG